MYKEKEVMNWGIIGYGNIAKVFEDTINSLSEHYLIALKTNKTLEDKKKKITDNYFDFFSTKNLNSIYISNLNNQHFSSAIKCIENRKNFIIEKPALNSLSEYNVFEKKIFRNIYI